MDRFFADTVVADILHRVSGKKLFVPTEYRDGFIIPDKYVKKDNSEKSCSPGNVSSASEETRIVGENEARKEKAGSESESGSDREDDVIIVDWYDENDFENPKVSLSTSEKDP